MKDNHIGSAVSVILRYTHTHAHIDIPLLSFKYKIYLPRYVQLKGELMLSLCNQIIYSNVT